MLLVLAAVSAAPSSVTVLDSFEVEQGDFPGAPPPVPTGKAASGAAAAEELLPPPPPLLRLARFFLRAEGEGDAMCVPPHHAAPRRG